MRRIVAFALIAGLAACSAADDTNAVEEPVETAAVADYSAAIEDAKRPATDKERDADRKPAELLAFAQIEEGEKVGDFIMGGGYLTRLLAGAVGPTGKVYAFTPEEFISFRPAYADEQDAVVADYENVEPVRSPITSPAFPEPLDTIITVMNFHDLYIPEMPEGTGDAAVKALYDALKPGGTLVVVDHSAREETGKETTGDTHRIDRQYALNALELAGFTLDATADLYARSDDPRDANVFDESIRGKTDQFALRLRKPA